MYNLPLFFDSRCERYRRWLMVCKSVGASQFKQLPTRSGGRTFEAWAVTELLLHNIQLVKK
jgi:hypothetical protein